MATLKQNSEALRAITDKLKSLPKKNELVELEVTENGEYNPPESADGFSKVIVATENKMAQYMNKTLTELTEVDFGSATEIGLYAFQNQTALTSVKIPNSVTKIGGYAFDGCASLVMAQDSLPNTVKNLGGWCFRKVTFPSTFTLPTSTEYSGANGIFSGSIGIETVIIPPSLKIIEYAMFQGCKELKNVVLHDGVVELKQSCFESCTALDHFEIPESVTTISSDLFNNTALVEIVFPDGIKSDISRCFTDCKSLKKVVVGKGITGLTNSAFRDCSALETVVMRSETPPTLHTNAFNRCYALKEIAVPIGSGDAYKTATNWSGKASIIVESEEAGGSASTQLPTPEIMVDVGDLYVNNIASATSISVYWKYEGEETWNLLAEPTIAEGTEQEVFLSSVISEWISTNGFLPGDSVTLSVIAHADGYEDSERSNEVTFTVPY